MELLTRYDDELRGAEEFSSARVVDRDGPVLRGVYSGGRGFIVHEPRGMDALTASEVREHVDRAVKFVSEQECTEVEWKTRGHDACMSVLDEALRAAGFVAEEPESVMIGRAEELAVEAPLPDGVTVRRITSEADVRAMCTMADIVFGDPPTDKIANELLHRMSLPGDEMELWVAELNGEIICTGRLEPVPGTEFAGIWGGATREDQRHRGIYRALTSARAKSALARGYSLIQSDSTEYSRPILERSGFVRVTTTTPYELTIR